MENKTKDASDYFKEAADFYFNKWINPTEKEFLEIWIDIWNQQIEESDDDEDKKYLLNKEEFIKGKIKWI